MRALLVLALGCVSVACGGATPVGARPTEMEMVLHVPCVTPPCGATREGPAPPPVMTGRPPAIMLALGWEHSCALVQDGGVWCWGSNGRAQLGDIGEDHSGVPIRVPSVPPMNAIWAGANQTCARAEGDGQLWCWGETGLGPAREPVFATSLPFRNVRTVALAYQKGCFIADDGALYCWGDYGVHGPRWDGPRRVPLEGATALRGGMLRSCAVMRDGGVTCWGMRLPYTVAERIGDPLWRLPDLRDVGLLAFSGFAPHPNMWLVEEGRVFEARPTGPLGENSGHHHLELRQLEGIESVVALVAGGGHYCARTSGGTAACWGSNSAGQVGDGTTATRQAPRTLMLTQVAEIAVGKSHSCARAQGKLFCWGANGRGQAGVAGVHDVLEPTEVPW